MKKKATCPAMIAIPVRKPVVPPSTPVQGDETTLLADLRGLIQSARQRIATVANATMTMLCWHVGHRLFVIAALLSFAAGCATPRLAVPMSIQGQGYELVFNDEFSGAKDAPPDPKYWTADTPGQKRRDAWNVEDASRQDGQGHLVITTRRTGDRIETGFINTQGKFEATHGYFECRAQMQKEAGLWSAFWIMSPTMGNPLNDPGKAGTEIDVVEYLAVYTNQVRHNVHWDGYSNKFHKMEELSKIVPGLSQGFHTYAVRWDAAGHVFYTDGVETGRSTNAPVSNRSQFLILSCEVESWAGDIQKAKLPDTFVVDYVRVWQPPKK
jgi:beta-glucanase (GH16 family)